MAQSVLPLTIDHYSSRADNDGLEAVGIAVLVDNALNAWSASADYTRGSPRLDRSTSLRVRFQERTRTETAGLYNVGRSE